MKTTRYLLALRPDVPVERHGVDPEFTAKRGHRRVAVHHRGLGQPHQRFRQRERPATVASARARGRKGGRTFALSKAQVRLAQAAMAHRDTSVSALCRELGINPVTLYRYVGPQGQLRQQGQKVLAT